MKYDNSRVRRQDRLLPEEETICLLRDGEYGFLSMISPEEEPYGIPVNYVWDGAEAIYIHCAPEGRKLLCIAANPQVAFCVVGGTHLLPGKFTTNYRSIVLACRATTECEPAERMQALRLIIGKYSPRFREIGEKYAEKSFHRTQIIKLTVESVSGKCKNIPF